MFCNLLLFLLLNHQPVQQKTGIMLFIIVLLLLCLKFAESGGKECAGGWVDSGKLVPYFGVHKSRNDYNQTAEQLLLDACPAEVFINNCFFEGIRDRAKVVMRREWVTTDPKCSQLSPERFLTQLTNRSMYFSGDSTMFQTYTQLVCYLYRSVPMDINILWILYHGPTGDNRHKLYNEVTCPTGAQHCHVQPGMDAAIVKIPQLNASLYFGWSAQYQGGDLQAIIDAKQLGARDIVVMNFGVHYNLGAEGSYAKHMKEFADDATQLAANKTQASPKVFFLESLPQHFTGDKFRNGYFFYTQAASWCMAYDDVAHVAATDFRNRLAERYLVAANIPRIQVAEALYSQWDTHLGGDSVLLKGLMDPADCTHYCAPSGVFRYIHRMIYNTVFDV